VRDRRGNAKRRPAIILTPTHLIRPDSDLLVMAITTTLPEPPPPWHVPLPWNADARKVVTRLAQRSAAVVNWVDVVRVSDVLEINGVLPAKVLREIERLQAGLIAQEGEAT
jgi:mRNA-degrading endonuclease toxin of MazEF toxin-antitoxin module